MITTVWTSFIEQLKIIDAKSYFWPWCDKGWKDANDYVFRVLTVDNRVMGYSAFKINGNEILLSKLCIRPRYRTMGFGTRLHRDLLTFGAAKHVDKLLTILHEESKYLDWAKSWGWEATGIKTGIYPDGTDGYMFERGIK